MPSALRTRLEAQNEMAIKGIQRAVNCILFFGVACHKESFLAYPCESARHTLGLQYPEAAILV